MSVPSLEYSIRITTRGHVTLLIVHIAYTRGIFHPGRDLNQFVHQINQFFHPKTRGLSSRGSQLPCHISANPFRPKFRILNRKSPVVDTPGITLCNLGTLRIAQGTTRGSLSWLLGEPTSDRLTETYGLLVKSVGSASNQCKVGAFTPSLVSWDGPCSTPSLTRSLPAT